MRSDIMKGDANFVPARKDRTPVSSDSLLRDPRDCSLVLGGPRVQRLRREHPYGDAPPLDRGILLPLRSVLGIHVHVATGILRFLYIGH